MFYNSAWILSGGATYGTERVPLALKLPLPIRAIRKTCRSTVNYEVLNTIIILEETGIPKKMLEFVVAYSWTEQLVFPLF